MASRLGKNEKLRRPRIHFRSHSIRSQDDVRIRYFDTGEKLPALILANGLGGPVSAWRPYFTLWKDKFRIITWDYRGLYGSVLPKQAIDLSVRAHALDLQLIMDHAGVDQATFIGWSMGVQVGLEFYSLNQSRLSHLVLMNGTYGRPLQGVPLPFSGVVLPPIVRGVQRLHEVTGRAIGRFGDSRMSYPLLRGLGLIAPGLAREHFQEMMHDFRTIDFKTYFELLSHLGAHDAEHTLSSVLAPTLVVGGTRDVITPPWLARRIVESIPTAELFMITGATHYSAAEFPAVIAERVEHFLMQHRTV
jgi:pimeloyl-ACP methyl ester carboxylesterase